MHAEAPAGTGDLPGVLAPALAAIRNNCHISDAQHATDFTLCVYLLKMREYFRWEHHLPFDDPLPHRELTDWLTEREGLWETLGTLSYEDIPLGDRRFDPFDAKGINTRINGLGYVYSSGLGRGLKPHFFLGELEETRRHTGYTLYISGRELARDLSAPPAMSLGNDIFIRRESLRRMLWEKIEEWRWNRPANAMQRAIACYDFENAQDDALDRMADNEIHAALLHEIGEVMAGNLLGAEWESLLASMPHSKAELMIRAVRDHLADALSTLPGMLENINKASLHFYMANLSSLRKALSPSLVAAYESWNRTGDHSGLARITHAARDHWASLAREILVLYRENPADLRERITTRVEAATL